METIYGHGMTFKIKQEEDGWWSIYEMYEATGELVPRIQAKDRAHALHWIAMHELPRVPFNVM